MELIYERHFGKAIDKEIFSKLVLDLKEDALSKKTLGSVHSYDYIKYRITYTLDHEHDLMYLFITGLADNPESVQNELLRCRREFLNLFGDIIQNKVDPKTFNVFDATVDMIHRNLRPKISLVGFSGVGKTTITRLIRADEIPVKHIPTITGDIVTVKIGKLHFHLWDFAGQEQFSYLWNNFVKGSDAVLLITDSSIENVEKSRFFLELIKDEAPYAKAAIIGNKQDLSEALKPEQIENILGLKTYSMIAKDAENRDKMIQIIADILEMKAEISVLLKPLFQRDTFIQEAMKALENNNFYNAMLFFQEISDLCIELGDDSVGREFYEKAEKIRIMLKEPEIPEVPQEPQVEVITEEPKAITPQAPPTQKLQIDVITEEPKAITPQAPPTQKLQIDVITEDPKEITPQPPPTQDDLLGQFQEELSLSEILKKDKQTKKKKSVRRDLFDALFIPEDLPTPTEEKKPKKEKISKKPKKVKKPKKPKKAKKEKIPEEEPITLKVEKPSFLKSKEFKESQPQESQPKESQPKVPQPQAPQPQVPQPQVLRPQVSQPQAPQISSKPQIKINPEDFKIKKRPKTLLEVQELEVQEVAKSKLKTSPFGVVTNPDNIQPQKTQQPTPKKPASVPIKAANANVSAKLVKPKIPKAPKIAIEKIKPKAPISQGSEPIAQKSEPAPSIELPKGGNKKQLENSLMQLKIKKTKLQEMALDFDMKELAGEITEGELKEKKMQLMLIEKKTDNEIQQIQNMINKLG
ncbi:MAG: GTP-binding protein [Promethearchaeota archaeon]|nr:MAG: GTP-binding protein [Candidatus Lokiarchaeota archaeon]